MANILVVVSSARDGRVADKVLPYVTRDIEGRGAIVTVADLKQINLPFFNSSISPAQPGFEPAEESAKQWTKLVGKADGIVIIANEYNHSLSAILKNALDWIKNEWSNKPIAFVGYGWTGASLGIEEAAKVLEFLGAKVLPTNGNLFFTKDLAPDGTVLNEDAVKSAIKTAIDELFVVL